MTVLLGETTAAKEKKIADIKKKILTTSEAYDFDYEILYGIKLNHDILRKALLALPAVASKRVVFIRDAQKLDEHNREIILDFAQSKPNHVELILDFGVNESNSFIDALRSLSQFTDFSQGKKQDTFDVTRAIVARKPTQALQILSDILAQGMPPLFVLAGIVGFWGTQRMRVRKDNFHKGLRLLEEADLNIKRSRLDPDQALEILVVKLSTLVI